MHTSRAAVGNNTLSAAEDQVRKWDRTVSGAAARQPIRRTPTTTDGTFQGTSVVLGTRGETGDYLSKIQYEIGAAAGIGGAGIWLSQPLDVPAAYGITGSAVANAAAQSFTASVAVTATKNQFAGRVVRITYTPTGGTATVFKSRIVSHPAYTNTTTIAFTLEDAPPASAAAPTDWAIEGVMSRRICEPGRAAGSYEWIGPEVSVLGGFIVTTGAAVIQADTFGNFT